MVSHVSAGIYKHLTVMNTPQPLFQINISRRTTVVILMENPGHGVLQLIPKSDGHSAMFHVVVQSLLILKWRQSATQAQVKSIVEPYRPLCLVKFVKDGMLSFHTCIQERQRTTPARLEGNYCRNPENEKEPWCYTTNPNTRWEYCQVQKCGHLPPGPVNEGGSTDCLSGNGYNYRGTISVTVSGRRCQEWDSMTPHRHAKTSQDFPNAGLFGNYCRNPDQDKAPWCFTTDPLVRWEYCRISKCGASPSQSPTIIPVHGRSSEALQVTDGQPDCQVGNGVTYRGTRSTTSSGRTCQHWSLMSPHFHIIFTPESHPDAGLEGNYCRNPDEDPNGPWCYTTDPQKRHDYCNDIPICEQQSNECGRPSVEPKRCFGSIVGGCISKPYSWPWQVSLRINFDTHFCGGSLIDTKWVVTAKQCLERSLNPLAYRVYLGIYRERGAEPSRQIILVDKIFLEPSGNDIALLKLKRPAVLTDKVALICLPTQDYILPNGAECYVSGWGETQGTGRDGVLKEAGFSVIENNICNQPEHLDGSVKNSELCAGNIEHSVGNCQGDTGGPLVCPNSRNQYILQGVMSRGCAGRTKPGVYVRVSFFVDWIENTIRHG
ncbi:plasminogen-like isoform X3 [Chiloscyllium plagiosum]|uniref:plasminogen-like isoform X3 n=1 Tax=Chiloscyllium plagiosum TaxID=36176 RepID=UPI001CB7EC55|nr:plasminogen-like isoform X3 [Chiloscyllium plagiosum]